MVSLKQSSSKSKIALRTTDERLLLVALAANATNVRSGASLRSSSGWWATSRRMVVQWSNSTFHLSFALLFGSITPSSAAIAATASAGAARVESWVVVAAAAVVVAVTKTAAAAAVAAVAVVVTTIVECGGV